MSDQESATPHTAQAPSEPETASAVVLSDRDAILSAREQGPFAVLITYIRLSGPGWLQSAITLGGGSLAGSLYLGVLAGFGLMWLQPLAMMLGIIMLSAIAYVTLSTGQRPFRAINEHVNPVLGWGWAIATMMANLVWCMPQFSLGTAALQQNLLPDVLGKPNVAIVSNEGDTVPVASAVSAEEVQQMEFQRTMTCVLILFVAAGTVVWFYDTGGWGIILFERILKAMVGIVVICFFGVVIKMSITSPGLDWSAILYGFIPNLNLLTEPSPAFADVLSRAGESADFWQQMIVTNQQKVMITAAATAVGINMTFLLPYSMLSKGWDQDFRGLAIFDLGTGLLIPFMLATSCVVIASATQFHAKPAAGLISEADDDIIAAPNLAGGYNQLLDQRLEMQLGAVKFGQLKGEQLDSERASLPLADRELAAMLVNRDAFNLANSLEQIAGKGIAQYVFGIGVLGMAISTIIILMLINGFVFCEMLGLPAKGWSHRIGCFLAALTGALGPFVFKGEARFWLAVPTSMFGMALLPIAYLTFFLMMNNSALMGKSKPKGAQWFIWNVLMLLATALAGFGSYWSIKTSAAPMAGYIGLGSFLGLAVLVQLLRKKKVNPDPV